jgi:hypothetical protein
LQRFSLEQAQLESLQNKSPHASHTGFLDLCGGRGITCFFATRDPGGGESAQILNINTHFIRIEISFIPIFT